jgi:DNA (cytosine-5)-methyltransferase 1
LVENVLGFLSAHGGNDFRDALTALNELGYAVDPFIINAAWFVPQSRQRLFIVATRGEDTNVDVPESPLRPDALRAFIVEHPEIRWNLSILPAPKRKHPKLTDILENLPDNAPEWWSKDRADYFLNQMSERHRKIADAMIARRQYTYATAFRRVRNGKSMAELRVDGLAGCLRTPRGGSGRQILFKAGFGKFYVRLLTPRECARLMGADNFTITGTLNQSLFGFGDAVCVPAIQWIAETYLNPLANLLAYEAI